MFGSNVFEVAIGIIFVFILVSTICTAVREGIESWLKTRAAYLEKGIRQLLNDPADKNPPKDGDTQKKGIVQDLYEHPLIDGLFQGEYRAPKFIKQIGILAGGGNLPSYIPAKNFAVALLDIAAKGAVTSMADNAPTPVISLEAIRDNVVKMQNPKLQRVLLYAIDNAQGDLNKAQANIEAWFNSGMDRVSGWYKRSTQYIIFFIALVVAVSLNLNTITIGKYLASNETARQLLVQRASVAAKDTTYKSKNFNDAQAELESIKLPIGWDNGIASIKIDQKQCYSFWNAWLGPLLGWLIMAFAATLGAPFWFDMLNKVMVIRSTVKPHQKSGEEGSLDKQDTKAQPQPVTIVTAPQGATGNVTPPVPHGEDDQMDCCGTNQTDPITADEDLPESKGGVV